MVRWAEKGPRPDVPRLPCSCWLVLPRSQSGCAFAPKILEAIQGRFNEAVKKVAEGSCCSKSIACATAMVQCGQCARPFLRLTDVSSYGA
jgi:hypothetical protein